MVGKKILVADDSITIQKVIRLALSNEGYEIQTASTGNEALEKISVFRPDIVLIDTALPEKSAFEVKSEINRHGDLDGTYFILMSSAFEAVDETKATDVRFHGRLTKPFDPTHLRQLLNDLLEGTSSAPPPPPPLPSSFPHSLPNDEEIPDFQEASLSSLASLAGGPRSLPDLPDLPNLAGVEEGPPPLTIDSPSPFQFKPPLLEVPDLLDLDEHSGLPPELPSELPPALPSQLPDDLPPLDAPSFEPPAMDLNPEMDAPPPPLPSAGIGSSSLPPLPEQGFVEASNPFSGPFQDLPTALPQGSPPLLRSRKSDEADDQEIKALTASTMEMVEKAERSESYQRSENHPRVKKDENSIPPINNELIETMVREQVALMMEKLAQKLVPEIAEKVIKQEIHRLLKE